MGVRITIPSLILVTLSLVLIAQQNEDSSNGTFHRLVRTGQRQLLTVSNDPRSVKAKPQIPRGSVAVVISTPKCGTGALAGSFERSFGECKPATRPFASTVLFDCEGERHAVKSHNINGGAKLIEAFRAQHPLSQCLVVTAIRDPQTWIPSLFMEQNREQLCDAKFESIDEMIRMYRKWVVKYSHRIRDAAKAVRPRLLAEFGASSLADEMKRVDANGGYSILDKVAPDSAFADCKLLFLKIENSDKWPEFINSVMPGVVYHKGVSRSELCPNIAELYGAIQAYQLSREERVHIVNNDADTAEYFNAYGF